MSKKKAAAQSLTTGKIEQRIYLIRDLSVMLDSDLAELYGVQTGAVVRQVKRNLKRFPEDFMFQLTDIEWESLKCQIGISNGRGGRRYAPYVFTEQGVAMLSSVLGSDRAVEINIQIMRAFVKLRELMTTHKDLARKIEELERQYGQHDRKITAILATIQKMLEPPASKKRRIGFRLNHDGDE